jgi:aldose 1-epimerase
MNLFQITAYIPGRGEIPLLQSPSLEEAADRLNGAGKDQWGDLSYSMGGAFLLPWASRLSGQVSPDGETVTTTWRGHPLTLRINSAGKYAVHGLIHQGQVQDLEKTTTQRGEIATGVIHAGNFGGHWISSTDVLFRVALSAHAIDVTIISTNVGKVPEPMAIGWHPYFAIPSRNRARALLHLSAQRYAETVPTDGLTTGLLSAVEGTTWDFRATKGALLGPSMNMNFSTIRGDGCPASLIDPESGYGLCVRPLSPSIHTIQVYSPQQSSFVAIEPQFNFPDPLGSEWKDMDTGLATVEPGHSATWHVQLGLFRP